MARSEPLFSDSVVLVKACTQAAARGVVYGVAGGTEGGNGLLIVGGRRAGENGADKLLFAKDRGEKAHGLGRDNGAHHLLRLAVGIPKILVEQGDDSFGHGGVHLAFQARDHGHEHHLVVLGLQGVDEADEALHGGAFPQGLVYGKTEVGVVHHPLVHGLDKHIGSGLVADEAQHVGGHDADIAIG